MGHNHRGHMKLGHEPDNVKSSSGITESKQFSIRTNAHAFKMLSSGLYSNKIGAVLREIATNATDAHIEFGTPDRPIEVKLPNNIDSQFYIKDFGPGLSHEDVMDLYTTYFASTKQASNDFTGAFGLGSKSPFSYTDSFTVTSVHDGEKRTYAAHLDKGSPTVSLLTTEKPDVDWPHGVSIGFSVKPGDYAEFQDQARLIYRWFRITPTVLGAPPIKKLVPEANNGHVMRMKDEDYVGLAVLQGDVLYPLNVNGVYPPGYNETGPGLLIKDLNNLVIKVPIGDVQVVASREEIQYDPATTKNLQNHCNTAMQAIAEDMAKGLRKYDSANWQELCEISELPTVWTGRPRYGFMYEDLFKRAGQTDAAKLAGLVTNKYMELPAIAGHNTWFRIVELNYRGKLTHIPIRDGTSAKLGGNRANIPLIKDMSIIYGSVTHAKARVLQHMLTTGKKHALVVVPDRAAKGTLAQVEKEAKIVSKGLRNMPMVDMSTLPLPPNFVSPSKKKTAKKVKGASLPPIPPKTMGVFYTDARGVRSDEDLSLVTKPEHMHFMVNGTRGIRVFDKNEDEDRFYDWRTWYAIWTTFCSLREELGDVLVPADKKFPLIRAQKVRDLALVQRGWKTSYQIVHDYLNAQSTKDALATAAQAWRPTVNLDHVESWLPRLVWLAHKHPSVYKTIEPNLAKVKLDKEVSAILKATVKAGSSMGRDEPVAVSNYNFLGRYFPLTPVSVNKRSYLTAGDLDAQIHSKYPSVAVINHEVIEQMLDKAPNKLPALLDLVLS